MRLHAALGHASTLKPRAGQSSGFDSYFLCSEAWGSTPLGHTASSAISYSRVSLYSSGTVGRKKCFQKYFRFFFDLKLKSDLLTPNNPTSVMELMAICLELFLRN
ncbi:hypothetical protein M8J75_011726 [Diaphorina citri]|nr:hypothetical protein M8J75_011726 [Diaphorina citri]